MQESQSQGSLPRTESFVKRLALQSIAPSTRKLYENRIEILKAFCREKGYSKVSKESFGCFLWNRSVMGCSRSTLQGYRSALLFYQECQHMDLEPDESPWAGDRVILRAVEGAAASARKRVRKNPRGYVSEEMLRSLVNWLQPQPHGPQLSMAFQVQYYAALRSCEVETNSKWRFMWRGLMGPPFT